MALLFWIRQIDRDHRHGRTGGHEQGTLRSKLLDWNSTSQYCEVSKPTDDGIEEAPADVSMHESLAVAHFASQRGFSREQENQFR